jgi:hypothetical protein
MDGMTVWTPDLKTEFQSQAHDIMATITKEFPQFDDFLQPFELRAQSTVLSEYVIISPIPRNCTPGELHHALHVISKATKLPFVIPSIEQLDTQFHLQTWEFCSTTTATCPPSEEKTSVLVKLAQPTTFSTSGENDTFPVQNRVVLTAFFDKFVHWHGNIFTWPVSHFPGASLAYDSPPHDFSVLRAPGVRGPIGTWALMGADLSFRLRLASFANDTEVTVCMTPLHFKVPKHRPSDTHSPGPYKEELLMVFFAIPKRGPGAMVPFHRLRDKMKIPDPQPTLIPNAASHGLEFQGATSLSYFLNKYEHLCPPDFLVPARTYASLEAIDPSIPQDALLRAVLLDNPHLLVPTPKIDLIVKLPGPILGPNGFTGRPTLWIISPPNPPRAALNISQQSLLRLLLSRSQFGWLDTPESPLQLGLTDLLYWYHRRHRRLPWSSGSTHPQQIPVPPEDEGWEPAVARRRGDRGGMRGRGSSGRYGPRLHTVYTRPPRGSPNPQHHPLPTPYTLPPPPPLTTPLTRHLLRTGYEPTFWSPHPHNSLVPA